MMLLLLPRMGESIAALAFDWAAQFFRCFAEHGKSSPLMAGAPVKVQPDELVLAFQTMQQA